MILYIDETENDRYFIVAGLLAESEQSVDLAYKKFKKDIKEYKIPEKYKSKVYMEFKSVYLDHDYSKIKSKMLEEIHQIDGCILYSCFIKKNSKFNQVLKESVYITLLSSIMSALDSNTDVIFDRFGKDDFEKRIVECAKTNKNIASIVPRDSQLIPGLQFADNICSVIRMYKSGEDEYSYYDLISDIVEEV